MVRDGAMGGTIVCGVVDSAEARGAVELAGALGRRLGLRVVLVSVLDGPVGTEESVSGRERRRHVERLLDGLARELGNGTEKRLTLGVRADAIARVADEEGADLIVVGSRAAGFGKGRLRCSLARELEAATRVPVLVAPPATRKRSEHRLAVDAATRR
jgi:nucleotide-binding universal stress UspA family protein